MDRATQVGDLCAVRIAQSTSFVVDDTGNHVLVHLEDRERRHHGPQLLSRILGRADRLPHQFLCALVSLQGDQIEQLLFGLVMDVHGCGAQAGGSGDVPGRGGVESAVGEGRARC